VTERLTCELRHWRLVVNLREMESPPDYTASDATVLPVT